MTLAIPDHWIVCLSQSQCPLSQTKSNWSLTIFRKVVEASAIEFKWLWLLNLPSLVWFVLDISFLSDNSQPFSKVVLCKYWQAFMMVKLKIEQGLLMEGTKKNKEYFLKKHIFWALPKWDKSTQTSKSTQCQGPLYPKQCLYFCQGDNALPKFPKPTWLWISEQPHYADDL